MTTTIEFLFADHTTAPVPIAPDEVSHFIKGEVPPAIADRFLPAGMPARGCVRYLIRRQEGHRTIGPSLARRAGTRYSALSRKETT